MWQLISPSRFHICSCALSFGRLALSIAARMLWLVGSVAQAPSGCSLARLARRWRARRDSRRCRQTLSTKPEASRRREQRRASARLRNSGGVGGGLAAVRLDQRGFPDHFARTDVIDDQFPPVRPVEHGIEVSAEDQADEVFRVVLEEQDVLVAQPALRRMGRHVPQQIGQPVQQRAPLQQGVVA